VECPNIHYDGTENRQSKRNESTDQEKQAADELEAADDVHVAAGEKRVQIFAGNPLGERRHRKEMQQSIGTKENKDQSKKDPGNNG
jgi:hypothetical protein